LNKSEVKVFLALHIVHV